MSKSDFKAFCTHMSMALRIWCFIFISIIAIAGYKVLDTTIFIAKANTAEGKIESFERWHYFFLANGGKFGDIKFPVVRFATPQGEVAQKFRVWDFYEQDKGRTVKVYYDPHNPQKARLDLYSDLWKAPSLLFGVGFVGLILIYQWWTRYDSPIV
jgi:hypothetical protein